MLRYYIGQTDEKKYKDEITYANAALGKIGTIDDIPVLEQHSKSRRPDIRMKVKIRMYLWESGEYGTIINISL